MPSVPIRMPQSREPTLADLEQLKAALQKRAARFHRLAILCILAGLMVEVGITLIAWITLDAFILWGEPSLVICGGGGVWLLAGKWSAQRDVLEIDLAIRQLTRNGKGPQV